MRKYEENERVLQGFLFHYRLADVMQATGLSRNTVYRLRRDPGFQAALRARRDEASRAAVNRMADFFAKDVELLQRIAEDPSTPAQTRVYAVATLFSQLRDWRAVTDIQERLSALEEARDAGGL